MKIRPLQDRVLIQRVEEEEKSAGGIIIPDSAKEKPQEGIVIATGKGKVGDDGKITPLDVAEGDRVLFGKVRGQRSHAGRRGVLDSARGRHPRRDRKEG